MVDLEKGKFFKSVLDTIFNQNSIDIDTGVDIELNDIEWKILDDL